jgi:hypothetical protein
MNMNKDEFDDLFDPELVEEFRAQFNELHIKNQQERINQDPYQKWFSELSQSFAEQGVKYFREPDSEIMYVQLTRDFEVEQRVEAITIREVEEYMNIGIPPSAVAAAIRAGLISPVFKFWREINDESDD